MGANGSSVEEYDVPATINVTPLVDVMLVLLVIFMVTAPMLQQGVEVNLPKAATSSLQGTKEQIVLSISKAGEIFLGSGNKLTLEEVPNKLKAIFADRPPEEQKIYIKADSDLNYGSIMAVMGKLHSAGLRQIGLVSAPGAADGLSIKRGR
ncbi:MAG TPA: protein TolR [Oligoflexia bacterium]|nr:protein TolR [Oligoflexia bacterium]HMP27038.1 protein TolR [Oligoflexia bacterium]